jgi:hypothetical protein
VAAAEGFVEFAEAASPRLRRTAFLLCGDWHTAEDLLQTTLAKVFVSWHKIRRQDAVYAYATRTLVSNWSQLSCYGAGAPAVGRGPAGLGAGPHGGPPRGAPGSAQSSRPGQPWGSLPRTGNIVRSASMGVVSAVMPPTLITAPSAALLSCHQAASSAVIPRSG